jgi:Putative Ig domain
VTTTGTVNTSVEDNDEPKPSVKVDNIGALILLSNPTPVLFPSMEVPYYSLSPFRELGDRSSSSQLTWYGFPEDHAIYLTGSINDQVARDTIAMPLPFHGTFRHSNPNERLEYEAKQRDGKPLPLWLDFDPKKLKISGTPPVGAENVEVMVTATDRLGHLATATFKVILKREAGDDDLRGIKVSANQPTKVVHNNRNFRIGEKEGDQVIAVCKSGFSEQIVAAGKLNRLMESRALLDSLSQL